MQEPNHADPTPPPSAAHLAAMAYSSSYDGSSQQLSPLGNATMDNTNQSHSRVRADTTGGVSSIELTNTSPITNQGQHPSPTSEGFGGDVSSQSMTPPHHQQGGNTPYFNSPPVRHPQQHYYQQQQSYHSSHHSSHYQQHQDTTEDVETYETAGTGSSRLTEEEVQVKFARLYQEGLDRKLARRQWAIRERLKARQREDELNNCTFKPAISTKARKINRPRSLSPENRAFAEVMRKKERLSRRRVEVAMEELNECTFRPLTLNRAKLAAEAMVKQPHLHSRLHGEAEERAMYRQMVRPQAVDAMEANMVYQTSAPKLTTSEIEDVVARLLAATSDGNSIEASMEYRPTVSVDTAALFAKRKDRLGQPDDVVERLTAVNPQEVERARDALKQEEIDRQQMEGKRGRAMETGRELPAARRANSQAEEHRVKRLQAVFMLLAQFVVDAERANTNDGDEVEGTNEPLTFEDASALVMPALALAKAATYTMESTDASEVIGILLRGQMEELNMQQFVEYCLFDARKAGPKRFMQPTRRSTKAKQQAVESESLRYRPQLSKNTEEITTQQRREGDVATRLIKSGKQVEARLEAKRATSQKQRDDEDAKHAFAPVVNENSAQLAAYRKQKLLARQRELEEEAAAVAAAAAKAAEEEEAALTAANNSSTSSGSADRLGEPSKPRRQAEDAHRRSNQRTSSATATRAAQRGVGPSSRGAAIYGIASHQQQRSLGYYPSGRVQYYDAGVAEHAAFGGPESLEDHGKAAMKTQLVSKRGEF